MHYRQLVEKYLLDESSEQTADASVPQSKSFESAHQNNETETELSNIEKIENSLESEDYREVDSGLEALRAVEDTFWLEYFAATSENKQAREIATDMLQNKERSLRAITIASEFADTRNDALVKLGSMIDKIDDPSTKALIAKNHPDKNKRLIAIKTISDNSIISEVVKTSKYEDSRWEGLRKLRLSGTKLSPEYLERKYSLMNLFDAVLENENTQSTDLILENVDSIKEVLKNKNEAEIFESATKALGFYKEVLACIASRSKNAKSRQSALDCLGNDYKKLSAVANNSLYRDSTDAAIEKLGSMLENIHDTDTLSLIATHSNDEQVRRDAIAKITDLETLKEIAKFCRRPEIKNIAINKISHFRDAEAEEIISKIAKEKRSGIKQKTKKKKIVIQQNPVRIVPKEEVKEQESSVLKETYEEKEEAEIKTEKHNKNGFSGIIKAFRDLIGF